MCVSAAGQDNARTGLVRHAGLCERGVARHACQFFENKQLSFFLFCMTSRADDVTSLGTKSFRRVWYVAVKGAFSLVNGRAFFSGPWRVEVHF